MPNLIGVRHVALAAKDPAALAPFYRDVLGMAAVKEPPPDAPVGPALFLAFHPDGDQDDEDYNVVFFSTSTMAHTALEVASLRDLQTAYRELKERGVPITMVRNHGSSLSFYFADPEGHVLEIYWPTGIHLRQNMADPLDLDRSEEELRREVERVRRQLGTPASATSS